MSQFLNYLMCYINTIVIFSQSAMSQCYNALKSSNTVTHYAYEKYFYVAT